MLPAFPGLDGGKLGHWGNQNEEVWKDDRWNQTDLGTLLCGVFRGPGGLVVPKGVCVRLGEQGELAACFNPETLTYEAVWRGGFLKFSAIRHGFLDGLRPAGADAAAPPAGEAARSAIRLSRLLSRSARASCLPIGSAMSRCSTAPWVKDGKFERIVAPAAEHPLRDGAARRAAAVAAGAARRAASWDRTRPYAVDTIQPPFENPWKALLFFSDHDFLPDGSALLCHDDGRRLARHRARRRARRTFAGGGSRRACISRWAWSSPTDKIYVLGRDQITRLHDLNGDGEADFYECFSNKMITSPAGHDFICGLARDHARPVLHGFAASKA